MNRRAFLSTAVAAGLSASLTQAGDKKPCRILLRSSWQTVNIGDIAHTPGIGRHFRPRPAPAPAPFRPLARLGKPSVAVLNRYWLTAEAASVYAQAAAVVSFELHSPIMAIANGTPAIHLRQPTDTRKGQMWRDIGLER